MTSFVASVPPPHAGLAAWLSSLFPANGPKAAPTRVLCSPCSASNEVFSVCVIASNEVRWFSASVASALFAERPPGQEVDVEKHLRAFTRGFDCLYAAPYHAVNAADVPGVRPLTVSVGDVHTARTCTAFLLPSGEVVCFESQDFFTASALVVLQRCAYASARTFDALLVPKSLDTAEELRLVDKKYLQDVSDWAVQSGAVVLRAPGEPIPVRLLMRMFGEGATAKARAAFLEPASSDGSEDDDDEWCAESEATSGYSEDDNMSDFDEHEAAMALEELKD